jgi:3-isopropylmalate/(R)-2-methylmalate dehydratase large subunit
VGKTIAEKILSNKSGRDVKANDIVVADLDFIMGQDGTSPLAIRAFKEMEAKRVFDPSRVAMVIDHSAPSPLQGVSELHHQMREFADEQGICFYDIGDGVCHQLVPEQGHVVPGDLVIGDILYNHGRKYFRSANIIQCHYSLSLWPGPVCYSLGDIPAGAVQTRSQ